MSEVKIPEGYKQTEVGVIPKDWEVKELGQIFELKSGETITSKNISSDDFYPCYGGNGLRGYTSTFNRNGEHVLIGRQGALCGNIEYVNDKFFASEHALVVSTIKNYSYKWLAYVLDRMHLNQYSESSAQPGLSALKLKKLKVSLPPIKEQTAIATALSDVDNLIGSLEKLIAKKEAIKTGTMQQLLTGKTRLPEFATHDDGSAKGFKQTELGRIPEDWDVSTLGELCKYQNGKSLEKYFNSHDGYRVISIGNYSKSGRYLDTGSFIDRSFEAEVGRFVLNRGDLAMILNDKTAIGTIIGRVILIDKDNTYVMNQRTMRLSAKDKLNSKYLHFLINSDFVHNRITEMAKPGTQIYVNTDDVLNFSLYLPKLNDEKIAIATILSDMDTEIQALQERLEKTRDIKQGMMQQLLTGKVRLAH